MGQADLGDGYTFFTKGERRGATIEHTYWMEGPEMDINNIPRGVLQKYYQKGRALERWYAGTLDDFPDPGVV